MLKKNKIELLAPAGAKESIIAAVANGADAVYFGGNKFNARASADHMSIEEIEEMIDYCHLRGVKVYITLNTLYKNKEIDDVLSFANTVYRFGADAFIVQDIGLFDLLHQQFPNIALHASTQMTTNDLASVQYLERAGFDRVVLSREVSLEEIEHITANSNVEIETFVHGALCVCYSGRCLMSSLIGERSGNRGRCAQPCRLKYSFMKDEHCLEEGYLLSPKDLMTLPLLPEIIRAGVHSVKIEGRMKSPEYVAAVTKAYRKYIDQYYENENDNFEIDLQDEKDVAQVFNRGGEFTNGYYTTYSHKDMMSKFPRSTGVYVGVVKKYSEKFSKCDIELTEELVPGDGIEVWTQKEPHTGTNISKHAAAQTTITITLIGDVQEGDKVFKSFDKRLSDKLKASYVQDTRKIQIEGTFRAKRNEPLYLKLKVGAIEAEGSGGVVSEAMNKPLSLDDFKAKFEKTGNTPFTVRYADCFVDEGAYIAISEINNLRRTVVAELTEKLVKSYKREAIAFQADLHKQPVAPSGISKQLTVSVSSAAQFDAVAACASVKRIYVEFPHYKQIDIAKAQKDGIQVFVALPRILREHDRKHFDNELAYLETTEIDGYLLRNLETIETKKEIALDYTIHAFHAYALKFLQEMGSTVTLSPELNMMEINALADSRSEVLVYGKLPLMTTALCPIGLYDGKKTNKRFCTLKNNVKDGQYHLRDRKGVHFPVMPKCDFCYAEILNASPIFMLHKLDQIINAGYLRVSFTDESPTEAYDILYAFEKSLNSDIYDETVRQVTEAAEKNGFTYGHFFRGVL